MVEGIVITLLFIGAVLFLFNLLKKNFQVKDTGCAKGCGSCSPPAVNTETEKAKATAVSVQR
jgi:hypothetical protein